MPEIQIDVPTGDPHNDQMAARARDDLDQHIESTRRMLSQATEEIGQTEAITAVAYALIDAEEQMPRERLASLLAVAMVRFAEHKEDNGGR